MLEFYKYSDTELKEILKTIVIIIDTREQNNVHIIDYFNKKKIKYISKKLNHGDYSFYIPKNEEYGIPRDLYFTDTVSIERKGSLEELSGNFTKDRSRIEEEFTRKRGKMYLLIEGATFEDILNHKYNTQYDPKSFLATLKTFEARYDISTAFVTKIAAGNFIYYTMFYQLREYLKGGFYGKVKG